MGGEYRKGKWERSGSPTLLNLKDSEKSHSQETHLLPRIHFSISSTTIVFSHLGQTIMNIVPSLSAVPDLCHFFLWSPPSRKQVDLL